MRESVLGYGEAQAEAVIPLGLCQCGCGMGTALARQTDVKRGYVRGVPVRYLPRHKRPPVRAPLTVKDFWRNVLKTDTCWLWLGPQGRRGYGETTLGRKRYTPHRLSWVLSYGGIPSGLDVCHHCDVPNCVRPDHLFVGTRQQNLLDSVAKDRFQMGERHYRTMLTNAQVCEMRRRFQNGETQVSLARSYGVSLGAVHRIVRRTNWKHLA